MNIETPWRIIGTPDDNEYAFQTIHDPDTLMGWFTTTGNSGRPIAGETLYQNWFKREQARVNSIWGDYVFYRKQVTPDGALVYTWVKNKTAAEKKIPFKVWREQGNHYWHGILHKVSFFLDKSFPLSTNGPDGGIILAPRMYDRIVYSPPVSEGSIFEHRLYLSPVEFKIGPSPVPIPTSVSWSYHGSTGSFPECLHPKLIFPHVQSAYASYSTGGGAVSAQGVANNAQVYPETNFVERAPYTLSDKQEETEAGWLRHTVIVHPPADEPDISQR